MSSLCLDGGVQERLRLMRGRREVPSGWDVCLLVRLGDLVVISSTYGAKAPTWAHISTGFRVLSRISQKRRPRSSGRFLRAGGDPIGGPSARRLATVSAVTRELHRCAGGTPPAQRRTTRASREGAAHPSRLDIAPPRPCARRFGRGNHHSPVRLAPVACGPSHRGRNRVNLRR
jgi:hypothetical protein